MIGDTAELAVKLKLDSQGFSSGITKAQSDLAKLNKTAGVTGSAFKAVAGHIGGFQKNIGRAFTDLGRGASQASANIQKMAFAAGALAVGGGVAAVKWAGDFQAQMQTINTIAFQTPEALGKIGDSIRQIALDTGQPLDDLTAAYYDLLSAGIKTADAQSVLNDAVKLGIGGLATTSETVDLLTTAYNAYGLTAAGASKATDMFAQAVADGKVKASEIAATFANVASVAKAYGVGIDQIAASFAYLTAQGVPAAEVTTEMQRAIVSLVAPSTALAKAQKDLKVNFQEEIKNKGLVPALQEIYDYSIKNKVALNDLLGRQEAVKFLLQTTGPAAAGYAAELTKVNQSAGMAAKQAAERQKGLNYELGKLKAAVHDAGIEIGTALIPKLTPLIKQLDEFLVGHREDVKRFAQDLADGFQHVAEWVGKIDFSQIADSLRVAATFGKGLISAFLAAPQWLQTAVVTGWGLNKLTGGAVQNIMADLTKAAVGGWMQQFLARGANPANPLFVMDVSGGLGSAAGAAGGIAGLSILGATGVAAAILGGALIVGDQLNRMVGGQTEGNRFGPGVFQHPEYQRPLSAINNAQLGRTGPMGLPKSQIADAVALGTERGIVHSGVFKKAQAVREAGGFKTSREALIAAFHSGKPLGTDALVTAEAIALAQGNRVRNDPSAQNLKSAAYNLTLLKRAQDKLPADLAAKLGPKIHSLEAAINRANTDISNAIAAKQFVLSGQIAVGRGPTASDSGPSGAKAPRKLSPVQRSQSGREHAAGFLGLTTGVSDLGIAGEAGQEAVAIVRNPKRLQSSTTKVFVTNWPHSLNSTSSSSRQTAAATTALAHQARTPKMTHQQEIAAALAAIKARAIAAGHLGRSGEVHDTLRDDLERGLTLNQIINVPKTTVTVRDVNARQTLKSRFGPTFTQAGAG